MACKRSTLEVGWSQRELQAATLAATLPDDRPALLAVAAGAVAALHGAILAGDESAARAEADRYDAVVWKLNGGRFSGCRSLDPEAGGNLSEAH